MSGLKAVVNQSLTRLQRICRQVMHKEWHVLCKHSAHHIPTRKKSIHDGIRPRLKKLAHGLRLMVQAFEWMSGHLPFTGTELR